MISVVSNNPHHRFIIPIKSEEYEPESVNGISCNLRFGYTAKYPDEPPELEIIDMENLEAVDEELLKQHILKEVS